MNPRLSRPRRFWIGYYLHRPGLWSTLRVLIAKVRRAERTNDAQKDTHQG